MAPNIKLDLISPGKLKNSDVNIFIYTYSIEIGRMLIQKSILPHYVWRSGSENAFVLPSCEQLDPLFHLFLGMAQLRAVGRFENPGVPVVIRWA